jgi:uncharacterized integral membrane protein
MPFRLVFMAIIMVVLVVFIGFNVDNRCDISLAVYTLKDIPVIITILSSFALGLITALPFALRSRKNKKGSSRGNGSGLKNKASDALESTKDERFPSGKSENP